MLKKLCSYPGCHKVIEAGVKYCEKHRNTDREKYREYKRRRMKDEEEARRQQFYNSKAWEHTRDNGSLGAAAGRGKRHRGKRSEP